ncbi:hypothetical protein ACH5RR_014993 [Cinchona calisaya]|uniref:Uncharacterized protein n=1 Tax=Cinchona calisaya TaxID=153742 RepID=A0ABD2ZRU6_9GENT
MDVALKYPCNKPFVSNHFNFFKTNTRKWNVNYIFTLSRRKQLSLRACTTSNNGGEKKTERSSFLSLEEAGLVEISGLSSHERFLCRLTISSLNLLRVISEQEGCSIEELNAGIVCDWFLKDKLKREQNLESAVLQWDDQDFQF